MSSAQAASYHEQDQNYYQNAQESLELSCWQGKGAENLGLAGEVENDVFKRLCQGIHPKREQILTDTTKRAGTDLTFSAPKSLSILSELNDKETDIKIREAHSKAVEKTMQFVEKYAQTREQKIGERKTVDTNNLVIAKFNHDTSREQDPQLHTHCFVLNMTQKKDGNWRALHNDQFFKNKMLFGQIYRNELAKNIKDLGYEIEVTNAKMGLWELKDFNQELLKEFSTRRKQVEQKFIELKSKFPHLCDAKLKEMATLDSRKTKNKNIDRKEIKQINIKRAEKIIGKELNPFQAHKSQNTKNTKIELKVQEILEIAQEILTSKESLFTKEQFIQESLKLSINSYTLADIEDAITQNEELVNLESNIYTTKEMINIEKSIVENSKNKKELNSISTKEVAQKFVDKEFSNFTQGQKEAFFHIATSKEQMIGIQGDAGSGKTYMLKALREFSIKDNLQGLALTGKAADEIEKESGIKSDTLHSFLNQKNFKNNQIYLVDEASMIGSRQLHQLQQVAGKTNSKIVLIGDTKQFQTIQAGSIFLELQKRDLVKTVYMSENLRAKTDILKEIYQNIKNKDISKAFKNIENNKLIKETTSLQDIKEQYLKDADNTLLIASKNKDKRELNQIIRDELKEHIKDSREFTIRENTALDDVERHYAMNYKKDQIIFINKAIPLLKAGSEHIIEDVDTLANTIILKDKKSDKNIVVSLSKYGANLSSFNELKKEFGANDKIIFTKNDKKLGIKNGQTATIVKMQGDTLHYKEEDGNEKILNLNNYNYIDWGYAITDYKAQGQTSKNVIVLADSQMANMNSFYVQATRAKESLKIYTDDIKTLKERAEQQQVKTSTLDYFFKVPAKEKEVISQEIKEQSKKNDSTPNAYVAKKQDKKVKSMPESYVANRTRREFERLTEEDYKELTQKTRDELKLTDPAPILSALGIEHKQNGNRYIFKARTEERTASANLYLDKNGEWKYKDFGSGQSGGVENLVMDATGINYKEALAYCIANTSSRDYLQERIDELKNQKTQMSKELPNQTKEELLKKREVNQQKAKLQQINSRVVNVTELSHQAKEYLATREIHKIPPEFKQITGEYKNKNGETKKSFGVGVLTKNSTGADIHFLKKVGNLKTMSFGEKDISFFQKPNSKDVAIFESKMDYAAAYQQIDFSKTDVVIANSTSNAFKVTEEIKNRYETIHFFNQNDQPGKKFVREIIDSVKIKKFSFIKYQDKETRQDINDLIKNRVNLYSRRKLVAQKEPNNKQQGENNEYSRRSESVSLLANNSRQHGTQHKSLKSNFRAFTERGERILEHRRAEFKRDTREHRKEIGELREKSNKIKEFESSITKELKTATQNHTQNQELEIKRSRR